MNDDPAATTVRGPLNAYDISIPDDELPTLADTYSTLHRAVERVLAAEPLALDIAVTFDPSASG